MMKLSYILLFIISLIVTSPPLTQSFHINNWAISKLETKQETVTNLQFYFHDTISGKDPTAIRVAQAADTEKSPTLFGALLMADDPLTETPDPKSNPVREMPIVGGTGVFRLARGYAVAKTHWYNEVGDAIVAYNVTIVH
ncbi:hypothetical protein Goklo_017052 [Gossypium klotzschianum]|uniref:Dirigent protein n=1 Tax=Gossypium klotzschianum TaxID=34286 RepID=A0A7J8UGW6_9ROSI|nr:hypothetical protein [Gossypium klotzschianum]